MTKIIINSDNEQYITRKGTGNWDNDDTSTNVIVNSFSTVEESAYHDLTVAFDPDPNKEYYLLYVRYSTGDSFSNHSGLIEYVGLFQNQETARKNALLISENSNSYSLNFIDDDGSEWFQSVPWSGYFERIEDIVVKPVRCTGQEESFW